MVVEDSTIGLTAALGAGMRSVPARARQPSLLHSCQSLTHVPHPHLCTSPTPLTHVPRRPPRCVVSYTPSTAKEAFEGAEWVVGSLGEDPAVVTVEKLRQGVVRQDDRVEVISA